MCISLFYSSITILVFQQTFSEKYLFKLFWPLIFFFSKYGTGKKGKVFISKLHKIHLNFAQARIQIRYFFHRIRNNGYSV